MSDGTDLDISFTTDSESIPLSPIGEYEVADIEGPVVFVGGAAYRSSGLQEMAVEEIQGALDQAFQ